MIVAVARIASDLVPEAVRGGLRDAVEHGNALAEAAVLLEHHMVVPQGAPPVRTQREAHPVEDRGGGLGVPNGACASVLEDGACEAQDLL
eukprot:CAMPEP_0206228390 /NCGR_PEP_ID=MMETSP0047_2-20121206/9145_1 /ASSEMBLY_ACC=CAM_ASM_000192 /TAXON_ID=195065 /ORGANISM="Chroomonas mesostigmatica_cf, Strain CCMP1168" /LENGTH=89 /DNA_ID=CAMNT_0053651633 /DNA_START=1038 /DNA_END=1307 /DNA_ORIENTATION=+